MDELQFTEKAKQMVADYCNKMNIIDEYKVTPELIYVVWACKTLQNNKTLLSTNAPDGRYYEVTYNGDKQEFYFDAYIKEHNQLIK
ncbi:hypothetical protein B9W73_09995 [Lactococcus lactis]|uniref:DUF6275 family protein n=1 Tax=Lactococcus lactis TaxID=1358 RepID=UPI000A1D7FEF|nr:DUF6275 family protein [Lactococcus lactis]OSP86480.1 hypothetical protein B9W73_09995 [Lactococcus lactis]